MITVSVNTKKLNTCGQKLAEQTSPKQINIFVLAHICLILIKNCVDYSNKAIRDGKTSTSSVELLINH